MCEAHFDIKPFVKTQKRSSPQTGGSDKLWIYLSWDETCVHTLGAASANRFNAPLNWRVIKKSQERRRVWRESQTPGAFCSVSAVWNLNTQLRPWLGEENVFFGLWGSASCRWIPARLGCRSHLDNSSERGRRFLTERRTQSEKLFVAYLRVS